MEAGKTNHVLNTSLRAVQQHNMLFRFVSNNTDRPDTGRENSHQGHTGGIGICIASWRGVGRFSPWIIQNLLRRGGRHLDDSGIGLASPRQLFTPLSSLELAQHHGFSTAPGGHSAGQSRHSARRQQRQSRRSPGHSRRSACRPQRRWRSPEITRIHSMG